MIDIQLVRDNPDKIKIAVKAKQLDPKIVDRLLEIDEKRRKLIVEIEELRAKRNEISESMSPSPSPSPSPSEEESEAQRDQISEGRQVKGELQQLEPELKEIEEKYQRALFEIPNPAAEDVKIGKNESENEVLRKWGKIPEFDFEPREQLAIGKGLDIIDTERASKVSGARFGYLKGDAVLLELALINFALETLVKEGFKPIIPPVLMKVPVFHSLGYSEHMGNENYYLVKGGEPAKTENEEENEYYLVGTAEHSIVPYFMNEILESGELPKRFVGFSTAFRREAGSYGKDTKGILRVHQFDKVEMVSFTKPEEGDKEHEFLLQMEEKLFQALKIPYQVVKMCTGDLGAPAARKYDLEAWMPGQGKYREVTSTSTCTDFQARRLNIKYRYQGPSDLREPMLSPTPSRTKYVHTLNGTAFAIGRTIIAILENYQQKDGSITIPEVLRKWMGKEKITAKAG